MLISLEGLKDQEAMGYDNKRKRNPLEEAGNAEELKHPYLSMTKKSVTEGWQRVYLYQDSIFEALL